jgi:hypothetical protein
MTVCCSGWIVQPRQQTVIYKKNNKYQLLYTDSLRKTIVSTSCCIHTVVPPGSNPTRTTDSLLKTIISTSCCIHTLVPPDSNPTRTTDSRLKTIISTSSCIYTVVPPDSNPTRTTDSLLKTIIIASCCVHTVVPPDDGPRYVRNMQSLTNCTKNKLCIKLVFLYNTLQEGFLTW